jgi:hypothetical protein
MSKPLPPAISEAELGTETYLRIRSESCGQGTPDNPYAPRQSSWELGPYWTPQQQWDGRTRFIRGTPRTNLGDYNPFAALKDD